MKKLLGSDFELEFWTDEETPSVRGFRTYSIWLNPSQYRSVINGWKGKLALVWVKGQELATVGRVAGIGMYAVGGDDYKPESILLCIEELAEDE